MLFITIMNIIMNLQKLCKCKNYKLKFDYRREFLPDAKDVKVRAWGSRKVNTRRKRFYSGE